MANATKHHGSATIPWIYQILPVLRPKLLENCATTPRSHKKNDPLALESTPRMSIPGTQETDVLQPCPHSTRLQQKVLPAN